MKLPTATNNLKQAQTDAWQRFTRRVQSAAEKYKAEVRSAWMTFEKVKK